MTVITSPSVATRPSVRRLGAVLLGLALAAPLLPTGADAAPVPRAPRLTTVVFRTVETDRTPRAADTEACADRLGPAGAAPVELVADLFAMRSDADGVVADETAARVGNGYLCLVAPDPVDAVNEESAGGSAYARVRLRGVGTVTAQGFCTLLPAPASPGTLFSNCRLTVDPDRARGLLGGVVSSNSVLNPAGVPGVPTGSVWSATVSTARALRDVPGPAVAGTTTSGDPGGEFFVLGQGRHSDDDSGYPCLGTRHATDLARVRAAPGTVRVRPVRAAAPSIGVLRTCSTTFDVNDISQVNGQLSVTGPNGQPVALLLQGRCHATGDPRQLRRLICALLVAPDPAAGIQGGVVTTLGAADVPVSEAGAGDEPLVTVALIPTALG